MKKMLSRLLLTSIMSAPILAAAACPAPTPDPVAAPPPPPPAPAPAPTPVATIPDYSPTGDDADLKKQGAAGIDDKNAALKAAELEGSIDAATKELESHKKK